MKTNEWRRIADVWPLCCSLIALLSPASLAAMPTLTIRNVPERVHQALRRRAAENARSVEAEVRALLESAATAPVSNWLREIADIQRKAQKAFRRSSEGRD